MKPNDFSRRVGKIDDRLIEEAQDVPNFGRQRRNRNIRRMVSSAAVLVLMVGSFVAGAFALEREPEMIIIEEIVYVEVRQEIIVVGDSGISLILSDEWEGKYEFELHESDGVFNHLTVIHSASRERSEYFGVLFGISFTNQLRPMDYVWPWPGFTIAITEEGTYHLTLPSDIQFDWGDPGSMEEYLMLSEDVMNIQIVMTAEMLASTTNASNWVQGTVFVEFMEGFDVVRSIMCDEGQSRIIREIIAAQDYSVPWESFDADLWIMFGDEEFTLCLTTGRIANRSLSAPVPRPTAILSQEDLSIVKDVLGITE